MAINQFLHYERMGSNAELERGLKERHQKDFYQIVKIFIGNPRLNLNTPPLQFQTSYHVQGIIKARDTKLLTLFVRCPRFHIEILSDELSAAPDDYYLINVLKIIEKERGSQLTQTQFDSILNAHLVPCFAHATGLLVKIAAHPFFNWQDAQGALSKVNFESSPMDSGHYIELLLIAIKKEQFPFVELLFDKLYKEAKNHFETCTSALLNKTLHYKASLHLWSIIKKQKIPEEKMERYRSIWHRETKPSEVVLEMRTWVPNTAPAPRAN